MIIEKSLKFISGELNHYVKRMFNVQESKVELSGILGQDGSVLVSTDNIGITLVNIKEEKVAKTQGMMHSENDGVTVKKHPDIKLNLYLLFSANFTGYDESLKAISCVTSFFQKNQVFDKSRFPAMDSSIGKLVFELETLTFEELNHLWGTLGAKYMPSLLYKMRMLIVDEDEADSEVHPIQEYQISGSGVY